MDKRGEVVWRMRVRKVKERSKSLEERTRQKLWTARRSTALRMRRGQHQEGRQQQRDVEMRLNLQSRKKMEEITRQQQKWLNSSPNRKL